MSICRRDEAGICPLRKLELQPKIYRKSEVSILIPINWFTSYYDILFTVWHSHCARASFSALVWCSDEFALHSCPLFRLQTQTLRNLRAHMSAVALCCLTITWQRIFKCPLQVTMVNALFCSWQLTSDIFDSWCRVVSAALHIPQLGSNAVTGGPIFSPVIT